jgi:hypothetical protein
MSSFGMISLKAIREMLVACAPGSIMKRKKHLIWVLFNNQTYKGLPTGEHGARDPEIKAGHVKNMINFLSIDLECVKHHLLIFR